MHANVLKALSVVKADPTWKIADLGAYNLNGSVKSLWPKAVGFDIVGGPDVDVVIPPGKIPWNHEHQYDLAVSTGTLQCAQEKDFYAEVVHLLKDSGHLFVSMCGTTCRIVHTSSLGTNDRLRLPFSKFVGLWDDLFLPLRAWASIVEGHEDMFYYGRMR